LEYKKEVKMPKNIANRTFDLRPYKNYSGEIVIWRNGDECAFRENKYGELVWRRISDKYIDRYAFGKMIAQYHVVKKLDLPIRKDRWIKRKEDDKNLKLDI
jgi:hypothetical protein